MRNIVLMCLFALFSAVLALGQNRSVADSAIAKITKEITLPKIPENSVELHQFGALPNDAKDDRKAIIKALNYLKKRNGGKLIIGKGIYEINGPIHLPSHVNVHLQEGAVLRFAPKPELYLPMVFTSWEGTFLYNYSPLIYAKNETNIAITGAGVIDGEGSKVWSTFKAEEQADKLLSRKMNHEEQPIANRQFGKDSKLRPHLLQFIDCKNILIEGVHFEDSPFWTTHFLRSSEITIRGISFNAHNKNNDGIDLEYVNNVLIEDVDFNNSDDNIAIKAGRDTEGRANSETPSQNIVIRNNRFKGLHALVIGSEMSAGVKNVFVVDNMASGYLKRGVYFKTNSDRGGYIKSIYIDQLELQKTEDCIYMTANYHGEGIGAHASQLNDIFISNVTCEVATETAIVIEGYPTKKAHHIYLSDIHVKQATNGLTLTNTKNVHLNEVIIGKRAGTPTAVK